MAPPDAEIEFLEERELVPVLDDSALEPTNTLVSTYTPTSPAWVEAARRGSTRVAHRIRTHARRHQGAPNPRHNSVVRRFVWEDAASLVARFASGVRASTRGGSNPLTLAADGLSLDPHHQDYRAAARLHVARTLGSHPVWLWVEPWWGTRSVIGLELRSRHRLHYSRRYFDAAHDGLHQLVEELGAPISPRSIRPPLRPRPGQARYGSGRAPTMLARSITLRSGK